MRGPVKKELLGEMVVILLPSLKLQAESPRGKTFQQEIHEYLVANFNGYTVAAGGISGYWKEGQSRECYGEHREYKVAVSEESKREALGQFLATLAGEMGEGCLYLETGKQAWLVYAKPQ